MERFLPPLFIGLAGLCLMFVLYSLWQSFRELFGHARTPLAVEAAALATREQLLMEKKQLLATLKDLEFERDVGKLSQRDFDVLNARYRSQAKDVMRALDGQISEYREQAHALVEAHLKEQDG
jgi:hypothetical protein